MSVFEKYVFKIVKFLSKMFPLFPTLYALSIVLSKLKYMDNCDAESEVSKSLCFNCISSGIDEFM